MDQVLSDFVLPSMKESTSVLQLKAIELAQQIFEEQKKAGLGMALQRQMPSNPDGFHGFLEIQNGIEIGADSFENAWKEIEIAIANFFENEAIAGRIQNTERLIPQRTLTFCLSSVSVRAQPDLILFYQDKPPMIIDWKVQANPSRDYWLQLATYALALVRCKPHSDWPTLGISDPTEVVLGEAQLLGDELRLHHTDREDLEIVEDMILTSGTEMELSLGGLKGESLKPKMFDTTSNPMNCKYCGFRQMCWEDK